MELARNFAHVHPVLNALLGCAVVLLLAGLIVFQKPVGRFLNWINRKAMQALGLADRDRDEDR